MDDHWSARMNHAAAMVQTSLFFFAIAAAAIGAHGQNAAAAQNTAAAQATAFGPDNPFYAASTLPFHAPPFDKIKDGDLPAGHRRRHGRAAQGSGGHRRQLGGAYFREHICGRWRNPAACWTA